jgi:hypothetical protein
MVSRPIDNLDKTTGMPNRKLHLSRGKTLLFSVVTFLLCLAIVSAYYVGVAAQRSRDLFGYARTNQRGWTSGVHRFDPVLGFATVPNAQGAEILGKAPDIPVRHDKDGFRIPVAGGSNSEVASEAHPILLTLGCSFTYGATNPAEDTYPYLVGQFLGGTTKNAGVCAYGLSQMMILARRLVPVLKPDYLIVQYSPWLVERALSPFAPAYFGKVPAPFIYRRDGQLALHGPVFDTITWDVPLERYRRSAKSVANFVSFFWNVGLPLLMHDDFHMSLYEIGALVGTNPAPSRDFTEYVRANRHEAEQYVYREISNVARGSDTKVVAVVIGAGEPVPFDGVFPEDFIVVDAQTALLRRLAHVDEKTYQQEYGYWRGDPPVLIDGFHPNATGHRIIAQEIASKINESRR